MKRALVTPILVILAACGVTSTASPVVAPYYLPRHADTPAQPIGRAEGVLELTDHCLYLGHSLVVWPADFAFAAGPDHVVISGGGWTIDVGDHVTLGGGDYASLSTLPSPILGNPLPCDGPYIWVSEVSDVTRATP